jgi:threonyl-tRNA synthetase
MFDPTAPGMPYWLPRGWKLFNALLEFWRDIHEEHGYQEISAPVINNKKLWVTSGHWAHYQENMFIIPGADGTNDGDDVYAAKPMNCPNAIMVYKRKPRSYKDLPLRFSETDVIHRKEKSGELNGLFRVQMFRQDDDHTLLTEDQIEDEISDIMDIAGRIYGTFGLTYAAELSTRPDDFMGDKAVWDKAEASLKSILDKKYGKGGYEINEGDGSLKQPVMIHRAIFGSMERFIGILIENFKGSFPFWLSPYQVAVVPIRTEHNEYAGKIIDLLRKNRIRVEADLTDNNMKEKIKYFKNYKDPYIIVLGDREAAENTVSINVRGSNKQIQNVPLDTFVQMCNTMNEDKRLELMDSVPEE